LHPKQKREAASVQTSQMNLVLFAQSWKTNTGLKNVLSTFSPQLELTIVTANFNFYILYNGQF
jgi:hypothetical protein